MGQTKTLATNSQKTHLRWIFLAPLWRGSARLFCVFFSVTWKPVGKGTFGMKKLGKFHLETIPKPSKTLSHWWSTWWIKTHPMVFQPASSWKTEKKPILVGKLPSHWLEIEKPILFPTAPFGWARQGMTLLGFSEAAAVEPSHEPFRLGIFLSKKPMEAWRKQATQNF